LCERFTDSRNSLSRGGWRENPDKVPDYRSSTESRKLPGSTGPGRGNCPIADFVSGIHRKLPQLTPRNNLLTLTTDDEVAVGAKTGVPVSRHVAGGPAARPADAAWHDKPAHRAGRGLRMPDLCGAARQPGLADAARGRAESAFALPSGCILRHATPFKRTFHTPDRPRPPAHFPDFLEISRFIQLASLRSGLSVYFSDAAPETQAPLCRGSGECPCMF
jgi:hypothetical protein